MYTMVVILYALLGLILLYLFLRRNGRAHNSIPGPRGLPLVGYAPYMKKGAEHETFTSLAEKYGAIFKISVFGQTIVILNNAQLIRAAFSGDKYKKFMNDRSATFYGEYLLFGSQSIAFMRKAYESEHGELRKAFTRGMHVYGEGKKDFEDKVMSELVNLVEIIERFQGKEFHMLAILRRSLTNVMSIILGGHDLKDDDEDLNMFWDFDEWNDFFLGADVNLVMTSFPFLRYLPGVYKKPYQTIQQAKDTIVRRYFYDKKATYQPDVTRGLVDFLIGEQLRTRKEGQHNSLYRRKDYSDDFGNNCCCWLAFSVGRRQCVGESLARSRLFLYLATMLQHWNFEMPAEHAASCDPRLGHFNTNSNCRPKPYMCRAVPRKGTME